MSGPPAGWRAGKMGASGSCCRSISRGKKEGAETKFHVWDGQHWPSAWKRTWRSPLLAVSGRELPVTRISRCVCPRQPIIHHCGAIGGRAPSGQATHYATHLADSTRETTVDGIGQDSALQVASAPALLPQRVRIRTAHTQRQAHRTWLWAGIPALSVSSLSHHLLEGLSYPSMK